MDKQHPNSMESRWYARPGATKEQCELENPLGEVLSGTVFPYIAKRVQLEVRPMASANGVEWKEWVIPASPDETSAYLRKMGWYDADQESEGERRVLEAERAAQELWQDSWFHGVPATETIFCAACQQERPAHGSNLYDAILLCNRCVRQVEVLMAKGELRSLDDWTQEVAAISGIEQSIDEAETRGYGCFPLPNGRWLEVYALYQYTRNKEMPLYDHVEAHWPYPDVRPTMYQGYLRSDWLPGEYFNSPDLEIVFTSRNRLFDYLQSDGKLPAGASRNPREAGGNAMYADFSFLQFDESPEAQARAEARRAEQDALAEIRADYQWIAWCQQASEKELQQIIDEGPWNDEAARTLYEEFHLAAEGLSPPAPAPLPDKERAHYLRRYHQAQIVWEARAESRL